MEVKNIVNRSFKVDFVRFVSIILIIMSHTIKPGILHELRCFDVVAMVFISAYCTKEVNSVGEYRLYLKKRIKRLLIPTYVLISAILVGTLIVCNLMKIEYIYDWKSIVTSYLLIDGIGYVWIIRILLINAILTPIYQAISKKINTQFAYFAIVAFLMILAQLACMVLKYTSRVVYFIIFYYLIFSLSYGAVFLVGQRINKMSNRFKWLLCVGCLMCVLGIYLGYKFWNGSISLNGMKNPPMPFYLLYGIGVTLLLFLIIPEKNGVHQNKICKLISYISINSFSIYFVHIVILKMIQLLRLVGVNIENSFVVFAFVLLISIGISFIISKAKEKLLGSGL